MMKSFYMKNHAIKWDREKNRRKSKKQRAAIKKHDSKEFALGPCEKVHCVFDMFVVRRLVLCIVAYIVPTLRDKMSNGKKREKPVCITYSRRSRSQQSLLFCVQIFFSVVGWGILHQYNILSSPYQDREITIILITSKTKMKSINVQMK